MPTDDRSGPDRPDNGSNRRPARGPHPGSDHAEAATAEERRLVEALDQVAADRPVGDGWASIRTRVTEPEVAGVVMVDEGPRGRSLRTPYLAAAAIVAVALIGGGMALSNRGNAGDGTTEVTLGAEDDATPTRGGTVRYAVPSVPTSGFCLPTVQYGTDDELIAGAIFEPLAVINDEGAVSPYLAESFTPNADHTEWTIALRPGITFHDGSPLDATIVMDNLAAHRGLHPDHGALFSYFRLQDVTDVEVVDDLTVQITTKASWATLPAVLATPSFGIMGRAQLDAGPEDCASHPIGTGPFRMDAWNGAAGTARLVRNPEYWQTAPDGQPYPYVDAVEFRTGVDLDDPTADEFDLLWTDSASLIAGPLAEMESDGAVERHVAYETSQPAFILLNNAAPPFDDVDVRRALAMSLDRDSLAAVAGLGDVVRADGPFAPSTLGHLDDPGFPSTDPAAARTIVDEYVRDGGSAAFDLFAMEGTDDAAVAVAIEQQAEAAGFEVTVTTMEPAALMDRLIAGGAGTAPLHAAIHRNPAAADPDQLSVWWWGEGSPINFSSFDDPTVDDLLRQGRTAADPASRAAAYEGINARFAEQVHSIWLWYQPAAVAARPGTGSITGPDLPDGSTRPTDLSLPHSLLGVTAP